MEEQSNIDKYFLAEITWLPTGNPEFPWKANSGKDECTIRINDFPEESLYTLLVNGKSSLSFDNWPKRWYW